MKKSNFYHCPLCGYLITKLTKEYMLCDFTCPKCKIKKLSSFKRGK